MGGVQSTPDFRALLDNDVDTPLDWRDLLEHRSRLNLFLRDFSIPFVSQLLETRRENFVFLFTNVLAHLETAGTREVNARGSIDTPQEVQSCVTGVRLLTRMIPHIIRDEGLEADIQAALDEASREKAADAATKAAAAEAQQSRPPPPPPRGSPPVHVRVVRVLTDMLFLPGVCVGRPTRPFVAEHEIHLDVVWATGFGVPERISALPSSVDIDQRRTDVLEALLACSGAPLYMTEVMPLADHKWTSAIVSSAVNRFAPTMAYSLVNTIASYDPVGYGLVPYSYTVSTDSAETVVDRALQLLLVLLDLPEQIEEEETKDAQQAEARPSRNAFREHLFRKGGREDYEFLLKSFVRLMNNPRRADNTYLPGSMKEFSAYQELIGIFWKMLDESPGFYDHCIHSDVSAVVIPLLFFMLKYRRESAHIGLIHVCTFVLLKLSPAREFALSLNADFTEKLPVDLPRFSGTIGDLLIIAAAKVMTDSQSLGGEDSLCQVLLTVFANVSPYLTKLCLLSSIKLLSLFGRFTKVNFIVSDETHPQFVFFLLEVFNNIIQYQYPGNSRLAYAILMQKDLFYKLAHIRLPPAAPAPTSNQSLEDQAASPSQSADQASESKTSESSPSAANSPSQRSATVDSASSATSVASGVVAAPAGGDSSARSISASSSTPSVKKQEADDHPWLAAVRRSHMLATVLRLLDHLGPFLEKYCGNRSLTDSQILEHIEKSTVVGVLPAPHSIVVRRFKPCESTTSWFTRYFWGLVFLRNQQIKLFDPDAIELFAVEINEEDDEFWDSDDYYGYDSDDEAREAAERRQHEQAEASAAAAQRAKPPRGGGNGGGDGGNAKQSRRSYPPPRRFRARSPMPPPSQVSATDRNAVGAVDSGGGRR